jgi:hypothetical protein
MSRTNQNPIARRRRPQAVVSGDSGFVLILVLPVAMLLMMTALSMVSRSNSATVAAARESRAQAARMAAEYGLNELMARVNTQDSNKLSELTNMPKSIEGSKDAKFATNYTIRPFTPPDSTVATCSASENDNTTIDVTVLGTLTDDSVTYQREITRTLRVCVAAPNRLRVRAVR